MRHGGLSSQSPSFRSHLVRANSVNKAMWTPITDGPRASGARTEATDQSFDARRAVANVNGTSLRLISAETHGTNEFDRTDQQVYEHYKKDSFGRAGISGGVG